MTHSIYDNISLGTLSDEDIKKLCIMELLSLKTLCYKMLSKFVMSCEQVIFIMIYLMGENILLEKKNTF